MVPDHLIQAAPDAAFRHDALKLEDPSLEQVIELAYKFEISTAADRRLESWADVAAIRDDDMTDTEDVAAIQGLTSRSSRRRGRRPPPQQDTESHHPGRSQKPLQQQPNQQRRRHQSPPPAPPTQQPQLKDQLPGPSSAPPQQPMATDEDEPMPLVPPMPPSQPRSPHRHRESRSTPPTSAGFIRPTQQQYSQFLAELGPTLTDLTDAVDE
ncbi:basic salivary proline-rich protein 3-like [Schistocerca piceifrons]|uniref:basic salivary proline-rich protein 3-like n=1 Tax=Schistocerca piceifrons TaxID=274613 RepID=UPI001F5FE932|nr:basic salivary proline-rich protein 3-like [Schistocerca piceifrons]